MERGGGGGGEGGRRRRGGEEYEDAMRRDLRRIRGIGKRGEVEGRVCGYHRGEVFG